MLKFSKSEKLMKSLSQETKDILKEKALDKIREWEKAGYDSIIIDTFGHLRPFKMDPSNKFEHTWLSPVDSPSPSGIDGIDRSEVLNFDDFENDEGFDEELVKR